MKIPALRICNMFHWKSFGFCFAFGLVSFFSFPPSATIAETGPKEPTPKEAISFQREIRPILSEYCFTCHGPDANQRKADLRLDTSEGLLESGIIEGKPQESDLYLRLVHLDPKKVMPQPKLGKTPTKAQVALIGEWIRQGAKTETHWAFTKVKRPPLPQTNNTLPQSWVTHPVDRFLLERLKNSEIIPSPRADKYTLIRRLTLDLLGLPPTHSEIEAFFKDNSPTAYETLVDRLLTSEHHGERLALDWLDAARYADTHGYHLDTARDMTKWREWVIKAYNSDMPYNQFTIEQLAGDLLPNATIDQKIASGFNRNHMITFEGGAIPEEYLNNYIIDRVNTTATVWLGMSIACAQCHDHKYDPITQKDYYRLYAFFNRLPESGIGAVGNSAPLLEVPTNNQKDELVRLDLEIAEWENKGKIKTKKSEEEFATWLSGIKERKNPIWETQIPTKAQSKKGAILAIGKDQSITVSGPNPATDIHQISWKGKTTPTGILLEFLPSPESENRLGRSPNGNMVLTSLKLEMVNQSGQATLVPIKAIHASRSQTTYPVENLLVSGGKGWGIFPEVKMDHKLVLDLGSSRVVSDQDELRLTLGYESPYGGHTAGRFRVKTTDLSSAISYATFPESFNGKDPKWAINPSKEQQKQLLDWYLKSGSKDGSKFQVEIAALKKKRADAAKSFPTAMVMQDMANPRDTFIRIRGAYDKKGDKVVQGVPDVLSPFPADAPNNRLGLAQWLVSRDNPLTARVYVNRIWQLFMGTGLVRTVEEFGSQGEQPSHPEFLDWLAAEFMEPTHPAMRGKAWSTRGLIRLIVTSEAYKQSAIVALDNLKKDPDNRLLSRASRLRLPAEIIRDQALAASGLLDRRIGGVSVNPYQPAGLWEELMGREDSAKFTAQFFVQSKGADLYRRSIYTFWKRTSPPAALATFDAPDRETCTVRRARTNTPLQALVLLNDPTYVEASRKLAEKILLSHGGTKERFEYAFQAVLARNPSPKEIEVLTKVLDRQRTHFNAHPEAATGLLRVGDSSFNNTLSPAELATWTILSSVLLNLDEAVNRS